MPFLVKNDKNPFISLIICHNMAYSIHRGLPSSVIQVQTFILVKVRVLL